MKFNRKTKHLSDSYPEFKAKWWYYLVLILIPILFLILLETGLRIFNYGKNLDMWVNVTDDKIMLNPDFAYRYFYNTKNVPNSNENAFDKTKDGNSFRIFILGGSSAAGYPFLPNGSFSNHLNFLLSKKYPYNKFEIINLSMSAINSYTLRDMINGVLDKSPDLIIIYAGHNEYYGALGVGSTESLGSSISLVNFALSLNKFKLVQLLRNTIKSVMSLFSGTEGKSSGGTLMSRMIKEQTIPLNSETYYNGLEQFKANVSAILDQTSTKKIPVILSTLTSNIKDQPPFISESYNDLPSAESIYNEAKNNYNNSDYEAAFKNYKYAKDLDQLRFRASEELNKIIINLSRKYFYPVINIDSLFQMKSEHNLVGDNLMTDHLHPTLEGYRFMGEEFLNGIEKLNILKKLSPANTFDTTVTLNNYTTKLDSLIGYVRIAFLKNDWPFADKPIKDRSKLVQMNTYLDSLSYQIVDGKYTWLQGHEVLANYYLKKGETNNFLAEINVLINQYPFMLENYQNAAEYLIKKEMYEEALPYLIQMQKQKENYFSSKWIGNIALNKNEVDKAIYYLNKAINFNGNDPQLHYNLAGAYFYKKDFDQAIQQLNLCEQLDPNYPNARNFKNRLLQLRNNNIRVN